MKERQKNILQQLMNHIPEYHTIAALAEKQHCSSRTIRNDLKTIEEMLAEQNIDLSIEKQPGLGIRLHGSAKEVEKLMRYLYDSFPTSEEENTFMRQQKIFYDLLMENQPITLQELSNRYYVNRSIIKEDLIQLKKTAEECHLDLETKQNFGTIINGKEKDKRKALAATIRNLNPGNKGQKLLETFFDDIEVRVVQEALNELQRTEKINFSAETKQSLLLHVLFTIKRIYLNQQIELTAEERAAVRDTLPLEWSKKITLYIEKRLNLFFTEHELAYLALHIREARLEKTNRMISENGENNRFASQLATKLIDEVGELLQYPLKKDKTLQIDLLTHLTTAVNRLRSGLIISNPLLATIKKEYAYLFYIVLTIMEEFSDQWEIEMPEEEAGYVTVHFQAAIERIKTKKQQPIEVAIVCHYGIGVSAFLQAKLEGEFPDIKVKALLSQEEAPAYIAAHALDGLLTTVDIPEVSVPTILISPLLNQNELTEIATFARRQASQQQKLPHQWNILNYTQPFLVYLNESLKTKEAVLRYMTEKLMQQGYVAESYAESVFERERQSSTGIGSKVALPHGDSKRVKHSSISILTLEQPIEWNKGEQVSVIFLLAVKKETLKEEGLKGFFTFLNRLTTDAALFDQVHSEKDKMNFLNYFKNDERK